MKADAKAEKLGQSCDGRGNSARLIRGEATRGKTPAGLVKIVTAIDAGERKAGCIPKQSSLRRATALENVVVVCCPMPSLRVLTS
jgi:hypothetical protein